MRIPLILAMAIWAAAVPMADIAFADDYEPTQSVDVSEAPSSADSTEPSAEAGMTRGEETLSTELSGIDSLDIAPEEYETRTSGGTRKTTLESTVFHRQEAISYNSRGARDPFRALIVDEKKEGEIKTDLLRLEDAILTGVIWSEGQYLAMVKDKDGRNFFLHSGDKIYNGTVVSVSQTNAVFEVSEFGDYSRTTLKVQS